MGTSSGQRAVADRFCVVAMAVNELPVVALTAASTAGRQDVIGFWQISVLEVEATPATPAVLFAKQGR
jgi:hypothetical protein